MRAIRINKYIKDYKELKVSEVPYPQPKDGEVIVKIEAVGINYVDLLYSRGLHQNNHRGLVKPPFTLGLEFAGTVHEASSGSSYSAGLPVFGTAVGSFAQYITVHHSLLHSIPPSFTAEAAAGLAATAPVSYGALILRGGLKPGETVLIHGAAGGLGLYAIQIAKAIGAIVIVTASSTSKQDVARRFGADCCVDYTDKSNSAPWETEVLKLTNGKGVDVVFDSVGLVGRSIRCLKPQGRILVVGFAGREGDLEKLDVNRVLLKQAQIIGYRFGETHRTNPAETARIWDGLRAMIADDKVKPIVFDKQYRGLESVKEAMVDLSERKVWGKAIVSVSHEHEGTSIRSEDKEGRLQKL